MYSIQYTYQYKLVRKICNYTGRKNINIRCVNVKFPIYRVGLEYWTSEILLYFRVLNSTKIILHS